MEKWGQSSQLNLPTWTEWLDFKQQRQREEESAPSPAFTALTRQTFVGKVMSLLFNMLSRLAIIFLPRSKHLLISWLQSPSAVIFEPPKIKSLSFPICLP